MQSMALVHQKLYGNAELTNVNIKQYVEELIDHIEVIMSSKEERPNKLLAIPSDITLNMNLMISLGLILNELITNSYKYAFNNSEEKWIKISLKKESNKIEIIYSDSGPGIPEYINPQESESLGLELIHVLTDQLEGEVHYDNSNGSTFTINFNEITRN
jgi:two-component sensor histidine kinase